MQIIRWNYYTAKQGLGGTETEYTQHGYDQAHEIARNLAYRYQTTVVYTTTTPEGVTETYKAEP